MWAADTELSLTRLSITLIEPASLRASLLLNAAVGGRLSAGLALPALAAYLRACGAEVRDSSEFFVDEYRENPMDYKPSQVLVELTLVPAKPR